jgi:hypothetical protein
MVADQTSPEAFQNPFFENPRRRIVRRRVELATRVSSSCKKKPSNMYRWRLRQDLILRRYNDYSMNFISNATSLASLERGRVPGSWHAHSCVLCVTCHCEQRDTAKTYGMPRLREPRSFFDMGQPTVNNSTAGAVKGIYVGCMIVKQKKTMWMTRANQQVAQMRVSRPVRDSPELDQFDRT